ncbi:MAG: squalene--hopene cyclase [Planctomycetota bacterium]
MNVHPAACAAAGLAIALLIAAIILIRRRRSSRTAGFIFLALSIAIHAALLGLLPHVPKLGGHRRQAEEPVDDGMEDWEFAMLDSENAAEASDHGTSDNVQPLPVSELTDLLLESRVSDATDAEPNQNESDSQENKDRSSENEAHATNRLESEALRSIETSLEDQSWLDELAEAIPSESDSTTDPEMESEPTLEAEADAESEPASASETEPRSERVERDESVEHVESVEHITESTMNSDTSVDPAGVASVHGEAVSSTPAAVETPVATLADRGRAPLREAIVSGARLADFAARSGASKTVALRNTGGDAETEAAVAMALRFLASTQQPDGSWAPQGGGIDRRTLGISRPGAGSRAHTGITGLSLLAMIGAGNTHHRGEYSDEVYRGLAWLIGKQSHDGSLAGDATIYSATYCHAMATLAMAEAAAMTGDRSAVTSATRAIDFSLKAQHPRTGGWRYRPGDEGDLSQLGWQAMAIDAGYRAGIEIPTQSVSGIQRFLNSVRQGRDGGLASYRPAELPSRTMTAEALATRLLTGTPTSEAAMVEAENMILQATPGTGQDNYYFWYYATVALHQRQNAAWQTWNTALKKRLLQIQAADGSFPTNSAWGGYGGKVYATAMATLCLESYYRHALRDHAKIAARPASSFVPK